MKIFKLTKYMATRSIDKPRYTKYALFAFYFSTLHISKISHLGVEQNEFRFAIIQKWQTRWNFSNWRQLRKTFTAYTHIHTVNYTYTYKRTTTHMIREKDDWRARLCVADIIL